MSRLLIFGLGYSAGRLAHALRVQGWDVVSTGRAGTIDFDDAASVRVALADATHILSSVPPSVDGDPVLTTYGEAITRSPATWLGYLSSTGVYGDAQGAWVDESAPIHGRRAARNDADRAWLAAGARVFRLPGIYGPGRSALERVAEGKAHRIDLPNQIFSRIHVDDIVSGVIAGFDGPAGAYNLADDYPCSQNLVIEAACDLRGLPYPPLQSLSEANLSPMALDFYAENRRVSNVKAKRLLCWRPAYPTYQAGLRALSATTKPASANTQPATASKDQ
ncbi:MAG: SDR family NAD(P)-dependent oxidoreductase [Sphingomonadaceae bacterium]